jgi:beta-1,4-glucuronyltransferase 1
MFVAGYQFQVLSPIFTVHWGLQNKKSRPAWRERQNNINRKHFEIFKREVFARYHKDPLKMLLPRKAKQAAVAAAAGSNNANQNGDTIKESNRNNNFLSSNNVPVPNRGG